MAENDRDAGLPGVAQRLAALRARHGAAEFAFEGSTTGEDGLRIVRVVVDASRRLTSLTVRAGHGGVVPSPTAVQSAVGEALVAAEAARSIESYTIARERGQVGPPPKRRLLTRVSAGDAERRAMELGDDPPAAGGPRVRSSVFEVLGLDDEPDPPPAQPRSTGPVVGGEPERGALVTLHSDGWTSSLLLQSWLARATAPALESTVVAAYHDAYRKLDARERTDGTGGGS